MKTNYKITIIITLIMLLGISLSSFFVFNSYSKVIKDSTRNVAELSTMNIYSEINNEITKPLYVSLTMANDSFLKNWLENESFATQDEIVAYLNGIKEKYEYTSVFLVSNDTLNYYHYDGINKVISPTDSHDVWYYTFMSNTQTYDLDVDVDEVTGVLTIFVNVKVFNDFGDIVAVVGVGLEMEYIQQIMSTYETEYELNVYLTDEEGLVQSHSVTENIETLNVFDVIDDSLKDVLITDSDILITAINSKGNEYIVSKLIDEIDWYLIVSKDTNLISRFFLDYFITTIIMIITVTSLVVYIVVRTLSEYQNKIYSLAKTDYLTLLLNRRGFDAAYTKVENSKEALVFITDIDRFKLINDKFGHSKGDEVLRKLAKIIDTKVSEYGKLSRWGGDEFTAVMVGKRDVLETKIQEIFKDIENDEFLKSYEVTISLGYTYTKFDTELDVVLTRADKALYLAKSKGGGRIEYIE